MLVRGTTNRNPDDTDITVEIVEGPDVGEFDLTTLRSWSGGTWSARFSTSGISTGTYTVEVDDGESTDRTSFTVVNDRETELDEMETLRQSLEELRTELDVLRQENNDTMERVEELRQERDRLRERLNQTETPDDGNGGGNGDGNGDGTDGETDDGGEGMPGFTAVAALVALVAVFLARRRT
jgi:PGF-CTERM protein